MNFTKKTTAILLFLPAYLLQTHVGIVNFEQLQSQAEKMQNDTLYVVNFWATWCDPCVKELPSFEAAYKKYSHNKVKMIFVSLNSPKEISKVAQFSAGKQLEPEVLLLDSGNPNDWIDKIDSSWSGAIPATVLYKHGKKLYFHEGELTQDNLYKIIETHNKK
ncbi:MAG: TlpA family protein disulfide reductase [Bacteroidia bacterium]